MKKIILISLLIFGAYSYSQFNVGIGSSFSGMLIFPSEVPKEIGVSREAHIGGVALPEVSIGYGFEDFAGLDLNISWTGLNTFSSVLSEGKVSESSNIDFKPLNKSAVAISAGLYLTIPESQIFIPKLKAGIGYANVRFDNNNDLFISGPFIYLGIGVYLGYYGW